MSTNLATRPFRNERLPWLVALVTLGLAAALSVVHAGQVGRLLAGDEARIVSAVRQDESRIAELERILELEPPLRIESAELAKLRAYKELVDRRAFPWRRLLSDLEGFVPEGVRLTRIQPNAPRDRTATGMVIELAGEARTKEQVFSLAEIIDASPVFSRSALKSLSEGEGVVEFQIEALFDPAVEPAAELAPVPGEGRK